MQYPVNEDAIIDFHGGNFFLSNFYVDNIGRLGSTVEHRFQAAKASEEEARQRILHARSAGEAKRLGRSVTLPPNWETEKVGIMHTLLIEKFAQEPLMSLLLATGHRQLVEGNTWNDKFWGVDSRTFEGKNVLGELLMFVRQQAPKLI